MGPIVRAIKLIGCWWWYVTDRRSRERLARVGWRLVRRVSGGSGFGNPVVGSITTVSAAAVTPAFSGTPVAGELLLGIVLANNTGAFTITGTGVTGWSFFGPSNNTSQITLAYKLNAAGSDPAPTFNSASATVMKAYLVRIAVSGGVLTTDRSGTGNSLTSPVTATASAADTRADDLIILAAAWRNSANTTGTIGYSSGYTGLTDDGSASSTAHISGAYQLSTSNAAADTGNVSYTGTVSAAAAIIASFKLIPFGSGWNLVSQGPVASGTTSVAPVFGQPPTAGDLLTLQFSNFGSASSPAAPTGWTLAVKSASASAEAAAIYWRIAAGNDTAPSLTGLGGSACNAMLSEYTGNTTLAGQFVDSGNNSGSSSPLNGVCGSIDQQINLLVAVGSCLYTTAATKTLTHTFNNGATANATSNNAVSTVDHYAYAWGVITTPNNASDSTSFAFTTTKISGTGLAIASFQPGPLAGFTLQAMQVQQAVMRAANW